MEAYRSVSLFHRIWRPFSGRGRPAPDVHLRSEPRTGTGTGRGRDEDKFSHLYHGLGWVGGEVRKVREGVIGGRQGEVR